MQNQIHRVGINALLGLALAISLHASFATAAYWEAKKLAEIQAPNVKLMDGNQQVVGTVPTAQMRSLMDIKGRIEAIARIDTTLLIAGDQQINAFAKYTDGRYFIGVTLGMLKLTDGNTDELASVVGHEIGHLVRNHGQETAGRDSVINLIGAVLGAILEAKLQVKYRVQGLGINLADLGAQAVSTVFSRDQEREADALGIEWMMRAGYNPEGAVRLWSKMASRQGDSLLVFLSTHPNPSERADNARRTAQQNNSRITQLASAPKPIASVAVAASSSGPPQSASLAAVVSEDTSNSVYRRGLAALQRKDYQGAFAEWSSDAGQQDPRSMYGVASLYAQGLGRDKSYTEAMKWYQRAADEKFAPAITSMGIMHNLAWGVPRDRQKAVSLLEEAAMLGDSNAEAALAPFYLFGTGTTADPVKAWNYAEQASRKGNRFGEYVVGRLYEKGWAVGVDYGVAMDYYERAASKGVMGATTRIGVLYEKGLGVGKDEAYAVTIYRKAATAGDTSGLLYLGRAYLNGVGVDKNPQQAFKLLYTTAERGSSEAQALIGLMYLEGNGVTKDIVRAHAWIALAEELTLIATDLDPDLIGRKRAEIESQMSKQQRDEAQTLKAALEAKIRR